jgi:hypothetical protein
VSATNAIGTGLVSAASNAIVPATVPGAPTNVQAVAGDKSASVSWAAPSSNGGLSISGYTATSTPGGFSASVGGTVRQATVSGLTNGTSYTFKVTATNAVGTSSPSAPSNAVTPAASALTLDPTIVPAFPPQTVGTVSASKQVTLTNNSGARVVASITTSQDYQQSNTCGDGIVANGGSCTVSVQFKPTQTGSRPGTLTVTYAGAGSPQKALLSGTGIGWNPWDRPGGQLASSPVAVSSATGIADGFARGTDGALWHWSNGKWESLGGHPASDPSVVSAGDGQFDVFVRFTDGGLWHSKFNGRWQPWQPLGGQLSGEPAAVLDAAGNLDVFVRGTDSHLYRASFRNGSWTWTGYGGVLGAPPAATSPVAGEVDAIVVGADHQLYRWSSAATLSGGWSAVGGRAFGKPGVTSSRPGQIDAFVEGTDLQLWHWVSSGSQSSWELVGGRLASSPAAVSWGAGRLDAFVQGTDHVLWHAFKGGSSWQWEGLGKQMVGTPGAVVVAGTRFDVFIQGSDNALYHRSFETT